VERRVGRRWQMSRWLEAVVEVGGGSGMPMFAENNMYLEKMNRVEGCSIINDRHAHSTSLLSRFPHHTARSLIARSCPSHAPLARPSQGRCWWHWWWWCSHATTATGVGGAHSHVVHAARPGEASPVLVVLTCCHC
jgi:hypothetical protein